MMENSFKSSKLEIHIKDEAYKKLKETNAKLCLLKSFRSSLPEFKLTPVAWICTTDFTQKNTITWKEEYDVFTASPELEKNQKLEVFHSYPLQNKQAFVIKNKEGTGIIDPQLGGFGEGLKIANYTESSFHFGLAQKAEINGKAWPLTPVFAQKDTTSSCNIIIPFHSVVVTFAPVHMKPGTIVKKSWNYPGLDVQMTEKKRGAKYVTIVSEDKHLQEIMEGDERWISWPKYDERWGINVQ